jgi:predicted TIM-barrel fold metal-dependent hydrolase
VWLPLQGQEGETNMKTTRARALVGLAMVVLLIVSMTVWASADTGEGQESDGSAALDGLWFRRNVRGAVIDVHTHVISQPLTDALTGGGVPASTADDLIARLDAANVEKAVVLSLGYWDVPDDSNMAPENDFAASIVAEYPDRLIGFCGINPRYESAQNEVDRCLDLPGMVGIKLNPIGGSGLDWENPQHAAAISAVLDSAERHDAPVMMHVSAAPLDDDGLISALQVIGAHPDVRMTIAHCGGVADFEIENYLIPAAAVPPLISLDNLFTDVSSCLAFYSDAPWSQRELIVWRLRKWGIERVFFGSDYLSLAPAQTPQEALATLAKYPFTRKEITTILGNDASAWLAGS